jgi:hypothetical protein
MYMNGSVFLMVCCALAVVNTIFSLAQAQDVDFCRMKQISVVNKESLWIPGPGNPRNREGDFIELKDGGVLFVYTHFTDEAQGITPQLTSPALLLWMVD